MERIQLQDNKRDLAVLVGLRSPVLREDSTDEESFTGGLLEYPQYTRPREFEGVEAPEVLLNGDHARIRAWRRQQALLATAKMRPDLFETAPMTDKERQETLLFLQREEESHAAP